MAKKRINYRPGKAQARMGLVVGVLFIIIGVTVVIPATLLSGFSPAALFGLVWTGMAVYTTVVNAKVVFGKEEETQEYFGGYVITEEEPAPPAQSTGETHDHIPSMALDTQRRLEQLQKLKEAGLVTDAEYTEKRREILREL